MIRRLAAAAVLALALVVGGAPLASAATPAPPPGQHDPRGAEPRWHYHHWHHDHWDDWDDDDACHASVIINSEVYCDGDDD